LGLRESEMLKLNGNLNSKSPQTFLDIANHYRNDPNNHGMDINEIGRLVDNYRLIEYFNHAKNTVENNPKISKDMKNSLLGYMESYKSFLTEMPVVYRSPDIVSDPIKRDESEHDFIETSDHLNLLAAQGNLKTFIQGQAAMYSQLREQITTLTIQITEQLSRRPADPDIMKLKDMFDKIQASPKAESRLEALLQTLDQIEKKANKRNIDIGAAPPKPPKIRGPQPVNDPGDNLDRSSRIAKGPPILKEADEGMVSAVLERKSSGPRI
jgi:hypothetical protein